MINATACILIGGKSKRFGSTKWKVKLGSKSVIEHIWSCLLYTSPSPRD